MRAGASFVRIGGVVAPQRVASRPELVPRGYVDGSHSKSAPELKWLLQKLLLGQDAMLPGSPGPDRRAIALQFCELINAECEVVTLSRDTNEADLKQRREIFAGDSMYTDQAPVRAALEGRVLILDGIEKAERNVLPTLNNLLENREMALEDGRFLVEAARYDALRAKLPAEEFALKNLERVHQDFMIIALGLPVPAFPGAALDPPLRSRFQARTLGVLDAPARMRALNAAAELEGAAIDATKIAALVGFESTLAALRSSDDAPLAGAHKLPHLPSAALPSAVQMLGAFPETSAGSALGHFYPTTLFAALDADRNSVVDAALERFALVQPTLEAAAAAAAEGRARAPPLGHPFEATLVEMSRLHALGKDFCLVGAAGEGK